MDTEKHAQILTHALEQIELFLLPKSELKAQPSSSTGKLDTKVIPLLRLDQTLYQVALADHIRTMQTMYRDSHDDQCLVGELRSDNSTAKLPIKHLLEKVIEGRIRSIALLKLCYGVDSLEAVRGFLDLCSSYALQGMWPQVEEKLQFASQKIEMMTNGAHSENYMLKCLSGESAASRIRCVYLSLREHAIAHNGQVTKGFVRELLTALSELQQQQQQTHLLDVFNNDQPHPSALAASLHTFFVSQPPPSLSPTKVRSHIKSLSKSYFADKMAHLTSSPPKDLTSLEPVRSWGEVVDFLRKQCPVMRQWVTVMERCILPQNKACLALPFRQCDPLQRSVAHPVQLSQTLLRYPSTARLLAGTSLVKELTLFKVEVPLTVNLNTGSLVDLHGGRGGDIHNDFFGNNLQSVFYELPVTFEEYLSLYVMESAHSGATSAATQLELLRVQALTLQGISTIYAAGNEKHIPSAAESALVKALNLLEQSGFEMTVVACELYNSIAQLMIVKHRQWVAARKTRIKAELDEWLGTADARREIKKQGNAIRKQHAKSKSLLMSGAEVEVRAKNNVTKKKLAQLHATAESQEDQAEMNKALEAAYRYLVRSYEILEDTHGTLHPAVGTACLAVASVQNVLEQYEDTREWLMRALRYMEKYNPIPIRAMTFTQTQLSQVLFKLGHDDESRRVLAKAAAFHMQQATQGILIHNSSLDTGVVSARQSKEQLIAPTGVDTGRTDTARSVGSVGATAAIAPSTAVAELLNDPSTAAMHSTHHIPPPILRGTALYEEIETATDLTTRAMKMSAKSGDKWPAAHLAEELAQLLDSAFGWDSSQAAEAYRQAGIRCAAVSDWSRATKHLKHSLESHEVLYGKQDPRTMAVIKLLQSVRRSKSGGGDLAVDGEGLNLLCGGAPDSSPGAGGNNNLDTNAFSGANQEELQQQNAHAQHAYPPYQAGPQYPEQQHFVFPDGGRIEQHQGGGYLNQGGGNNNNDDDDMHDTEYENADDSGFYPYSPRTDSGPSSPTKSGGLGRSAIGGPL